MDCGSGDGEFSAYDVDDEMIGYLCLDCQDAEEEASGEYVEFDDEEGRAPK